jgi:hypothetical protein
MNKKTLYCDNCGDDVTDAPCILVADLPQNIASANKGESAVLCFPCESVIYKYDEPISENNQ